MQKLNLDGVVHNRAFYVIACTCVFLLVVGMGIFFRVRSYNSRLREDPMEADLIDAIVSEYLEEPKEESEPTGIPVFTGNPGPTVMKFAAPLPEKYLVYKSSSQGLRDKILAENTGGTATSGRWHNGFDYPCPEKTPVYATKNGYVVEVWPSYYNGPYNYKGHSSYGGLIILLHPDSTITLYAHLSFTEVHEGDYVSVGKEIGWSGGVRGKRGSGTSTGPHLHYSIYLDMEDFLDY